jgi:hypothetical protein
MKYHDEEHSSVNDDSQRWHGPCAEHIPSDFVVDQWASDIESGSYPDFQLLHYLETSFVA